MNAQASFLQQVEALFSNGQIRDGVKLLEQVWPSIPREECLLFLKFFDVYITGPLDVTLKTLVAQGRYGEALEILEDLYEVLGSTPAGYLRDVNKVVFLSTAYSRVGVRCFNVAKDCDSLDGLNRAISSMEKTISLIETALSMYPGLNRDIEPYKQPLSAMYTQVGKYFGKRDQFNDQIPPLQKAVEINPNNEEAWLGLGYAYWGLGLRNHREECLNAWRHAADLGNAQAVDELKQWGN